MLHVHCGDTSADALRRSGVPGEVIVWCDLLTEGPILRDVPWDAWLAARAESLARSLGGEVEETTCGQWLSDQELRLGEFAKHEEVVLWFDACLFDQTILIRHLDWFSQQSLRKTRLSLICIGEFPGFRKFKGLGELTPEQLVSLLDTRREVTREETALAVRAWAAIGSQDPRSVEALLAEDLGALPYLREALLRHLQRFPSARNGLDRLEQEALEVIAAGSAKLVEIFWRVSDMEEHPYFGDTTLWGVLDTLAAARVPLLDVQGPGPLPRWNPPSDLSAWTVSISQTGREVLSGKCDAVKLNGIDRWVGGVHVCGEDADWRWDDEDSRLRRRSSAITVPCRTVDPCFPQEIS